MYFCFGGRKPIEHLQVTQHQQFISADVRVDEFQNPHFGKPKTVSCNPNLNPANIEQQTKTNPKQLFDAFDPKPQFDQLRVVKTPHVNNNYQLQKGESVVFKEEENITIEVGNGAELVLFLTDENSKFYNAGMYSGNQQ